jgi:soluble lytic murein transglycosylase-like protein
MGWTVRAAITALLLVIAATPANADARDAAITEASQRFAIPQAWIRAVIAVESAGDARAVSRAGAQGLMQIMPDTWAVLRTRLQLGADPFDIHDNILAGTAALRELYDRFGPDGFLAAYNIGPQRYIDYLTRGVPLAAETRAYLIRIAPLLGDTRLAATVSVAAQKQDWRSAPLFAAAAAAPSASSAAGGDAAPPSRLSPRASGLFASLTP